MGITPLQQNIPLRAHYEESGAEREHVQALEIDVAAIHHVERAGLRNDLVEHSDVGHLAVCNPINIWDVAMEVEQRVQFDGGLVLAKTRPREQRKTEVNGRGVQRINLKTAVRRSLPPVGQCFQ
jgi:hypothetical protein